MSEPEADPIARELDAVAAEYVSLDLRKKAIESRMAPLKRELVERMTQDELARIELPQLAVVSLVAARDGEAVDVDETVARLERYAAQLKELGRRASAKAPMKATHTSATVKITHRHGLGPSES